MQSLLKNIDLVNYFGLELNFENDRTKIAAKLHRQVGEYIFLKLADGLDTDQVEKLINLHSGNEQFNLLKRYIPDLETRINEELVNFRKECGLNV